MNRNKSRQIAICFIPDFRKSIESKCIAAETSIENIKESMTSIMKAITPEQDHKSFIDSMPESFFDDAASIILEGRQMISESQKSMIEAEMPDIIIDAIEDISDKIESSFSESEIDHLHSMISDETLKKMLGNIGIFSLLDRYMEKVSLQMLNNAMNHSSVNDFIMESMKNLVQDYADYDSNDDFV